jgi:hypothetical protein
MVICFINNKLSFLHLWVLVYIEDILWFASVLSFWLLVVIIRGNVNELVWIGYKTWSMWYSNTEKNIFLDLSSTNSDTLFPVLYQCVETRSEEVLWLLSQPLPHLVGHYLRISNVFEKIFRPTSEPFYEINTSYHKQKVFLSEWSYAVSHFSHEKWQQNTALR